MGKVANIIGINFNPQLLQFTFRLEKDLCIVKFVDIHPIDIAGEIMKCKITRLGLVESVRFSKLKSCIGHISVIN